MPQIIESAHAARARRYQREHAPRLRALAYRMLGSRADAEDMVQDAWLRWADVDEGQVEHAGAFLSRLVTHLCLDKMRSAAARREQYVGVWLPEPLLDDDALFAWAPSPETQAEFAQDVSMAFMLALERLAPLERAAFLLREVFDLDYDEVAEHLGRSEAACRQLISRARKHVKDGYARYQVSREECARLVDAFTQAVQSGDASALARLLSEDAQMMADGGGRVSAAPQPLHGSELIARAFIGFAQLPSSRGWRFVPVLLGGLPGCLVVDDAAAGALVQTIVLVPAQGGRVQAMYVQRNPEKLGHIARHVTNAGADPS